ncbi:hypothetical protein AB1Y20_016430 [Prymnesium parvum]|uniref:Nitroreductase domain-containing protein n=1 Tax=Prymnesium parvum TaxID=97485 RepID=A0AB34IF60_PRYPA
MTLALKPRLPLAAAAATFAAAALPLLLRALHSRWRRRCILSHVASHRSIRKFLPRPVDESVLRQVLSTAMRSSNNGNMQTYSCIITQDKRKLEQLALIHDNSAIASAPVLLTFVSDWSRMTRWCHLRGATPGYDNFNAFLTGALDAMVAAQSAALCAEAASLGVCFLGSTIWEPARLNAFFSLPPHVHVVTSLMLGHPAEHPPLRARLPAAAHLHREAYVPMDDGALAAYYAAREVEGWARYERLYGGGWAEKLRAHRLENLAQVYATIKYSGRDFRVWSRRLAASLEAQGFGRNEAAEGDEAPCACCGKWSHCLDPERFGAADAAER